MMSKLQTSLKTGKERKRHTWAAAAAAAAAMVPTHFVGMWEVSQREKDTQRASLECRSLPSSITDSNSCSSSSFCLLIFESAADC